MCETYKGLGATILMYFTHIILSICLPLSAFFYSYFLDLPIPISLGKGELNSVLGCSILALHYCRDPPTINMHKKFKLIAALSLFYHFTIFVCNAPTQRYVYECACAIRSFTISYSFIVMIIYIF